LLKLFNKVSSARKDEEYFITKQDFAKMFDRTKLNSSDFNGIEWERAIQTAYCLLFPDDSGLVNFSQFAHFHICMEAAELDQLLPEAMYRVLTAHAPDKVLTLSNIDQAISSW